MTTDTGTDERIESLRKSNESERDQASSRSRGITPKAFGSRRLGNRVADLLGRISVHSGQGGGASFANDGQVVGSASGAKLLKVDRD